MTQTSTHSYDCTGFRSICFYCGSWNWSICLSSDGFFSLYDAKCQLQKEILTPWKLDVPLIWNAGLFWVNWLFLIIKGIKGKSPYIVSPKSAIRLKKLVDSRKSESIKNIKQPPRLQRPSSHLTLPSEQIGFTVRTNGVCVRNPLRVGPTAMQHEGFRVLGSNSASQAFLQFSQSLGWSPAHSPEMRTIKRSYETTNTPALC